MFLCIGFHQNSYAMTAPTSHQAPSTHAALADPTAAADFAYLEARLPPPKTNAHASGIDHVQQSLDRTDYRTKVDAPASAERPAHASSAGTRRALEPTRPLTIDKRKLKQSGVQLAATANLASAAATTAAPVHDADSEHDDGRDVPLCDCRRCWMRFQQDPCGAWLVENGPGLFMICFVCAFFALGAAAVWVYFPSSAMGTEQNKRDEESFYGLLSGCLVSLLLSMLCCHLATHRLAWCNSATSSDQPEPVDNLTAAPPSAAGALPPVPAARTTYEHIVLDLSG